MKKYFYSDGKEKHGPFTLDELKKEPVQIETLIWFEGLDNWTKAGQVQEMIPVLELKPPPISPAANSKDPESQTYPRNETEPTAINTRARAYSGQSMFSQTFSFDGRIRRLEYGISFIIFFLIYVFLAALVESGEMPMIALIHIPNFWFLWAQGAKRCHDLGNSGWFQIIPFYGLWLIFAPGENRINEYGPNPKGLS